MRKHIKYDKIPCGGALIYSHTSRKYDKKAGHVVTKRFYKCQKCGNLVNIIINKDYNTLKLQGEI
jgi:hypothetical protein